MPRGRGYTKVDLRHLLEDLRDAYPGGLEETILRRPVERGAGGGGRQRAGTGARPRQTVRAAAAIYRIRQLLPLQIP